MPERPYRVLIICSHPVQYAVPIFRQMAQHPRLDIQVAYCSLHGAEPGIDREFGIQVKWDVPLLDGYPWVNVPNRSPRPGLGSFFGLVNPGLWGQIAKGNYDAVVALTGYMYLSFWIAMAAAKFHSLPLLFGTDGHDLASRDGKRWKIRVKRLLWPRLFGLADVVIVASSGGAALMRSLGISSDRLVVTLDVVDNKWWLKEAEKADRALLRRGWGVPLGGSVVLSSGKLQPWKCPSDVLHAFAKADVPGAHLVYVGEGALRPELESRAASLGVAERVHFLGFTNQSQLPAVYCASDLLVLASAYEPFGLVVNEAMLCRCPVLVSDRVGAVGDLVLTGQTGYTYPCGDVNTLANFLRDLLLDRERLGRMGEAARKRMETWSPRESVEALVLAIERSLALSQSRNRS